jgi:uncharacterized protein YjbI with pentapeptide repeats
MRKSLLPAHLWLAVAFLAFAVPALADTAPTPEVDALVAEIADKQFKTIINCEGCDLRNAGFDGFFLRLAAFQRTDLTGAKLRGADMTGIHLARARLDGADLSGANLAGSELTRASFRNAVLRNARLDAVRVHHADFTGADIRGANLRILEFVNGLSLRNVDARNARFDHAYLGRVDISGADFRGANFTRVSGLTNEQLATACGDATTILPEGLQIPHCNKPD